MCSCRGGYEGTGCEGAPECLDDEGGPLPGTQDGALDLAALTELAGRIGHVPRRELRCHPDVSRWLMLTLPEAKPEFPFTGAVGSLTGVPVIENDGYQPGEWELYEDGEAKASGRIRVPSWVTEPIKLEFAAPSAIERLWLRGYLPAASPVPMAGLSSIV